MIVCSLLGDNLKISWSNSSGSHTGFLPIGWLKDFDYSMMIKRRDEAPPLVAVSCVCVCRSFIMMIFRTAYQELAIVKQWVLMKDCGSKSTLYY